MDSKEHWERVYGAKRPDTVSWYQEHAERSVRLIVQTGVPLTAGIIDVGGGASTLVDDLVARGYSDVTVLDLSEAALAHARARLGETTAVTWLAVDITRATLPVERYDVWHDRAVFHFLTNAADRDAYVANVLRSVRPGGHVIVATFAEDGPERCSGLPVVRYRPDQLHGEFGDAFDLRSHEREEHQTPGGAIQSFVYCYCRKVG
ncbi:MAG: hypothetical protein AMXMBFR64_14500 [Myxococcales bacterium]